VVFVQCRTVGEPGFLERVVGVDLDHVAAAIVRLCRPDVNPASVQVLVQAHVTPSRYHALSRYQLGRTRIYGGPQNIIIIMIIHGTIDTETDHYAGTSTSRW
jgi:hypothetical protein